MNGRFVSVGKGLAQAGGWCSRSLWTSASRAALVRVEDANENEKFICRVIMANEKQRNSLGLDMIRSLRKSIESVDLSQCRVLVISSSSPKVFSSGHNLKEFTLESGIKHHETVFTEFTELCLSLQNLPIPTIAEVGGLAAAAGFQLASSCDLIVASRGASFSTPGVKFGVFCSTPGVPLSRNVSSKISLKMLFTGEPITAQEAYNHGIVSDLVASDNQDDLRSRVVQIAKQIQSNSRSIVSLGKKCFYEQIKHADVRDAYQVASQAMLDNLKYEDTQSGLKAFASKTKPVWTHSDKKLK